MSDVNPHKVSLTFTAWRSPQWRRRMAALAAFCDLAVGLTAARDLVFDRAVARSSLG
jgi:hypothetical protein